MKKVFLVFGMVAGMILLMSNSGCDDVSTTKSDAVQAAQTERILQEGNRQIGMPGIVNFQEKKMLKWIYELCDKEDMICYAYLCNEMNGTVGQFLGKCIGYGIPYSTQFSNPEKVAENVGNFGQYAHDAILPQAEPNGLFKPVGLSATWLIMIDPETNEPRPVYIEPSIIVSPFKLK